MILRVICKPPRRDGVHAELNYGSQVPSRSLVLNFYVPWTVYPEHRFAA
jgi:hypothetical protein